MSSISSFHDFVYYRGDDLGVVYSQSFPFYWAVTIEDISDVTMVFFNHFVNRVTGGNTRPAMLFDVSNGCILVGSAAVSLVNSYMFRNICTWEVNAAMVVLVAS